MSGSRGSFEPSGLTIIYRELGTISIDELAHALWEDIQVLKDMYNVRYIKAPRLKLVVTDEHGDPIKVRRPGGGYVNYLYTHHFRPACKDYDL